MIIKTFVIEEEAFSHGDSQGIEKQYFEHKADRDNVFKNNIQINRDNKLLEEIEEEDENEFIFHDGSRWRYTYRKTEEELKICSSLNKDGSCNY